MVLGDARDSTSWRFVGVSKRPSKEHPSLSCLTAARGMSPRLPMVLLVGVAVRMLL